MLFFLCAERHLSVEVAAAECGVSTVDFLHVCDGILVSPSVVLKIAKFFGVSVLDLLGVPS